MADTEKLDAAPVGEEKKENKKTTGKIHLRVLHCSDIHLDAPVFGLSAEKSEDRRRALRKSFGDLMNFVRERKVNIVLFSGDLFDTEYATNTTAELFIRELRNCPDTVFIIAPGRSDAYEGNPIYTSGRLPQNCYVFSEEALSRFDMDAFHVTVYGWAFRGANMTASPLADKRVDDASRINLVCGYADLDGPVDSGKCPIPLSDLNKFGADYYAFGSRHESGELSKIGGSIYAYAGSLECTGFEDPGLGGANLVSIRYQDGELSLDVQKIPFGYLRFHTERIDITGISKPSEIMQKISTLISDKKYGVETALRVELVGSVDPAFSVLKNFESDAFGLYFFDIVDKTMPLFGTEHFHRDMSAKGELFRTLLPMLEGENEEDRLVAAKAFRAGLAALEHREID